MSVIDRVESAKHTIVGSPIGKAVAKATSREIIGPKKKHVDYLIVCLNYDNVSIPNLVDMLFERTHNSSWIVTFKGLVTFHYLMSGGNERFIQCLASRSATWMLQNFLDKNGVQGYDMSHAIRRYSHYLSEKAFIYRTMGFDFCRVQRGKENGVLRNMDTTKLLKALPEIQKQLDALLSTDMSGNELTNGVITAAFMLLFKDAIRVFACYNDGIINLLVDSVHIFEILTNLYFSFKTEQYFDMKKADCKAALEIYKKFVNRMERVSSFLKVAEEVGIDRGDIPDLTQAPSSLLTALENHLLSLEKGKALPPSKPITLPAFNVSSTVETMANPFKTDNFAGKDTVRENALEHERQALRSFEQQRQASVKAPALAPPQHQQRTTNQVQQQQEPPKKELLNQAAQHSSPPQTSGASDLLQLNNAMFPAAPQQQSGLPRSSTFPMAVQKTDDMWSSPGQAQAPWAAQNANQAMPMNTNPFNAANSNNNNGAAFRPVFDNTGQASGADVLLGDLLTPEPVNGAPIQQQQQPLDSVDSGNLSSSLAKAARSLAGPLNRFTMHALIFEGCSTKDDLSIHPSMQRVQTQKGQHQWRPQQQQVRTGGANFQSMGLTKTSLPPASQQPAGWGGANAPPASMQAYPGQHPVLDCRPALDCRQKDQEFAFVTTCDHENRRPRSLEISALTNSELFMINQVVTFFPYNKAPVRMQQQQQFVGNNPSVMPYAGNNYPIQASYNQRTMQSQDPFGPVPGTQVRF
eukprot:gene164-776_t